MFGKSVLVVLAVVLIAFGALYAATAPGSVAFSAAIPVTGISDEVTLSPDGSRVYVVTRSGVAPAVTGNLVVIDATTQNVLATVDLGFGAAFGAEVSPDGSLVYVAISRALGGVATPGTNRVAVVDTVTNTLIGTLVLPTTSGAPTGTAISLDGSTLYVTDRSNGNQRVFVVDTTTLTLTGTITGVGPGPVDIVISPDGSTLYAANRGTPDEEPVAASVAVIDTATNTVTTVIPILNAPSGSRTWIAITPDGSRVYATTGADANVAVIDTATNSATAIATGDGGNALDIAFTPDGLRAFVTKVDDVVVIINTDPTSPTYNQVIDTIPVPTSNGIAVKFACGTVAYVAGGPAVSVLSNTDDDDGDGVCGSRDNCPVRANANQLDTDGDGVGDACDNCASTPNANQTDTKNQGDCIQFVETGKSPLKPKGKALLLE